MAGRGRKEAEAEASSSGGKAAYADDHQFNVGVTKETTEVKSLSLVNKNKEDGTRKGKEILAFGTNEGVSGAKAPEEIGMGNVGEEMDADRMAIVDHEVLYEVQAIRKKRNYRGQLQYLIKWRHYPEKDNTWEPYDNIKYCTDIIEAFEKRLQKGKSKSKKASVPTLTIERGINGVKQNPKRDVNSHYMREKNISNDQKGKQKCLEDEAPTDESTAPSLTAVHDQGFVEKYKEGGAGFAMQDYVRRWREKEEAKGGVGAAAIAIFLPNCQLIDIAEHGKVPSSLLPTGAIPFELEPQGSKELISRLTGAQKRKSGHVKRFVRPDETVKKAMDAEQMDLAQDLPASNHVAAGTGTGTGTGGNKVFKEDAHITKVLELVRVVAPPSPIPGHIMPVCIIFKALRSDGTEVLVSNRELRADNPSLLLDFYEENLHYTGP